MAKFEIFENVDLVKARRFGGERTPRESIYPVAALKVGQAFFAALEEKDEETGEYLHTNKDGELMTITDLTRKIQGSVSRLAKTFDVKLAVRSLPASEDAEINPWGEAGVGVWRVAGKYAEKAPKAVKQAA